MSAKAVDLCAAIELECGTRSSHRSSSSHDRLTGANDLHLVCGEGDRGPPHRKCGQEQISACRDVKLMGTSGY